MAWFLATVAVMAAVFVVFLIYFYAPYWKVRGVPGPPPVFLVGQLPQLADHGPDIFRVLAKNYGPIFRFHMGRQPLVIVANAELCKEVGIKKFKDIRNRSRPPPTIGSPLHQEGLFLTRDSTWISLRNTITPLYQPTRLAGLIPTMQTYINKLCINIRSAAKQQNFVPFDHLALTMSIDIIGKTAFGIEFGLSDQHHGTDDEISEFLNECKKSTKFLKMDLTSSLSTILGLFVPFLQSPCKRLLEKIPGTADQRKGENERKLCRKIDSLIAGRTADRRCQKDSLDFLTAVLDARDAAGPQKEAVFADNYVRALTFEHLLAGTKTTAFTISSVVYLVSQHPEVEHKLVEEIDRFGAVKRTPYAEELQTKFPYMDQVIKEAMRFHTVSPLIARETSEAVEIAGHLLPAGTYVWLAPGVLSKDPTQFPDPDVFRPERFDPQAEEEKRRHPYAHIPFGIGPRACIGQKFALQQIKLTLIHLYRHFLFRASPLMESPPQMVYDLVLGFKRGVKLVAINRHV